MTHAKSASQSKNPFGLFMRLPGLLVILWGFSWLTSCQSSEANSLYPYLKFDRSDEQQFVNYNQNTVLTFTSPTAPSRSYKVDRISQSKKEYTVGMGFFTTYASKYYDYDDLSIVLKNQNGKVNEWLINYRREPTAFTGSKPDFSTVKLLSGMKMWEWNSSDGSMYPVRLDDKSSLVSLPIGNQLIAEVQKIASGSSWETKSNDVNRYDWNINVVYFHEKLGVLGFDDVAGNQWRLSK